MEREACPLAEPEQAQLEEAEVLRQTDQLQEQRAIRAAPRASVHPELVRDSREGAADQFAVSRRLRRCGPKHGTTI